MIYMLKIRHNLADTTEKRYFCNRKIVPRQKKIAPIAHELQHYKTERKAFKGIMKTVSSPSLSRWRRMQTAVVWVFALTIAACHSDRPTTAQLAEAEKWAEIEYQCYQAGLYDSCLACLQRIDRLAGNDDTIKAFTSAERATINATLGNMRASIAYSQQSMALAERIGDNETFLNMCSCTGVAYRRLGMIDSALVFYKKGLSVAEQVEAKDYVASFYNNIAVLYIQRDRMAEARKYLSKQEYWAKQSGDSTERYNVIANKAAFFIQQGKYRKAITVVEPHLNEILNHAAPPYLLKVASPLLTAYIHENKTNEAHALIKQLRPAVEKVGVASIGGMGIMENEARLYHQCGEWKKELAVWNLIDSLSNQNQGTPKHEVLYRKAECQQHLGNEEAALQLMRQAYLAGDSLKNSEITKQMSEFSMRFKTQEKEIEAARLTQEKAQLRVNLIIALLLLVVACAVFTTVAIRTRYRRRVEEKEHEAAISRRYIAGMEEERSRLARELHDGTCNDLLGLSMLMNREGSSCLAAVRSIRDNVRRISHDLMPPSFSQLTIDSILDNYLNHYPLDGCQVAFSAESSTDWHEVSDDVAYQVYRVVQETVGNIVKHSRATFIDVTLTLSEKTLQLVISNDGAEGDAPSNTGGIGTTTTADRLNAVGGSYAASVEDGIYRIEISIPPKGNEHKKTQKND